MRTTAMISLLAWALAIAPAAAENESAKDAFKKTEKGMGRLLEAMGKEVKKTVGTPKDDKSKQKKKAEKDRQ